MGNKMSLKLGLVCGAVAAALLSVSPASAGVINFDEFAADNSNGGLPSGRYAGLGVTFTTTDDGATWAGLGGGDPGNWGISGTNGDIFAGFNGESYNSKISFSSLLTSFSLDASRSNGSSAGSSLTVEVYKLGALVGSQTQTFGAINTWSTFAFTGSFDEVRFQGAGQGYHPYGIDNLRWETGGAVPEPATWAMMITGFGLAGASLRSARRKPVAA